MNYYKMLDGTLIATDNTTSNPMFIPITYEEFLELEAELIAKNEEEE